MKLLALSAAALVFVSAAASFATRDPAPRNDLVATAAPEAAPMSFPARSVGHYCAQAIPRVWAYAAEKDADATSLKGLVAQGFFERAAEGYCACNDRRFNAKGRTAGEKAFYGKIAGLNLMLKFSSAFPKERVEQLRDEGRVIARKHRLVVERRPKWMKTVNREFSICQKEQMPDGVTSAFLKQLLL
ncbi:hypothetical protein N9H93_04640 [Rhizobiaceae bacterium]|nr:hypothetical protein [Rhizobiaceae bacterium]